MQPSVVQPAIELHEAVLRDNARAWRRHAGVPVWAVVKAAGYGWGALRVAQALRQDVEGFFVADGEEARELRRASDKPVAVFAASDAAETVALLDDDITPNISALDALAAALAWGARAGRPARIRVGVLPAAGWSGLLEHAIVPFARAAAAGPLEVELWTHLTVPSLEAIQRERFARALAIFKAAGVRIAATDVASTFTSAREGASAESRVRIGIGLFGANGDGAGPKLGCAIRIEAPVVAVLPSSAVEAAGYREPQTFSEPWLAVVRCGYADGLPARLGGSGKFASVGMQYAVLSRREPVQIGEILRLLDTTDDLSSFLTSAGISPHEFVVGFQGRSRESSLSQRR